MNNGRRKTLTLLERFRQWFNKIPWRDILFWLGVSSIALAILSVVIPFILKPRGVWEWLIMHIPDDARNKYLLSATAQVLGAVFALVFSISLIATQFVSKYTHRPAGVIFHKKIFIYMGGFAVAVVFPLWWIVNPIGIGSFLSLVLGSLFVLSVPVFFLYLIKMNIEGVVSELKRIGLRDVEIGNEERARKMINALDNIGMGAYTDRNFEVFELAEKALAEFALGIEKTGIRIDKDEEYELHKTIFTRFFDSCVEVIDNRRAATRIVEIVGKAGAEASSQQNYYTEGAVRDLLDQLERLCDTEDRKFVSDACARQIARIILDTPFRKNELPLAEIKDLLELQCRIHNKHISNKWEDVLLNDVEDVFKYIIRMIKFSISEITNDLDSLLRYLDFFMEIDNPAKARTVANYVSDALNEARNNPENEDTVELIEMRIEEYMSKIWEQMIRPSPNDTRNWSKVIESLNRYSS